MNFHFLIIKIFVQSKFNFLVNSSVMNAYNHIVIIFHGIDTYATIFVNNNKIGITSNMFLKYSYDIKKYLQVNKLKLIVQIF